MKQLANQMQEGGLGRKGINWMLDNKGYQGALGGGVDMKSDYAFNKNLTPEHIKWMMQQPGFSGGLSDSSNQLQGDLFQQFPELIDAYLGGMGKTVGYDDSVVNVGPDGRPYSSGGGYGFYQGQGGQSSKDQWIAAQQDAYARHAENYANPGQPPAQMPPGGGVPNVPIGGGFGTGGGQGPGGITRTPPPGFATDGAGVPGAATFGAPGPYSQGPPPGSLGGGGGIGTASGYGNRRRRAVRPFKMPGFNPPRTF